MPAGKNLRRSLVGAALLAIVAYGAIVVWFSVHESDLVFFPERTLEASPGLFGIPYRKVQIASTDSTQLACWVIPASDTSGLWLLYLHGNAGNIAKQGYVEHYAQLRDLGLNILAVDYRGYGESSGRPTEQGFYDDARAGYEYLRSTQNVSTSHIVVYGYSIGSAVAVELASRVPCAALILEGAFTSLADVGEEYYPLIPVRWMARNRFDAKERIGSVAIPKLFIHARDDRTIPIRLGRELFEMAPGPKSFLEVRGGHENAHNVDSVLYYGGIQKLVRGIRDHISKVRNPE